MKMFFLEGLLNICINLFTTLKAGVTTPSFKETTIKHEEDRDRKPVQNGTIFNVLSEVSHFKILAN